MRKFLATLIAWALLSSAPAFAGAIALISGTGSNGAQSNLTFNAGTSLTLNFTSSVPSGSAVVVFMSNNSSGTVTGGFSCTDTQSNTYTNKGFVQGNAAAAVQTNWSLTTHPLTSSDSVTCTQSSGASGITGQHAAFSNVNNLSTTNNYAGNATTSTVTSLSTGSTGTLQCATGTTGCELIVCNSVWRNSGTMAVDAGFITLSAGSSTVWGTGYKIQANNTAVSCTNTNTTADRAAIEVVAFNSNSSGAATAPKRSLLGVGQ